ncbi:acriflavin resistance protein [Parvibaculum lavamentivorans DS-1]|uniref:Acriflavin resistance protein n=1 Tax=Parvibaculum lavamentivorans (strain DS-1 / DSM 13023 / NCIMB 13966) TaxID=402881 RepID=A7HTC1_PARL1|nr:efflux RND transporter permease subunit [Parvibaculum lavamentivorans]ABS63154.1 acriflavin resistance protein [Parvibaculum lavamentivorans DS-1]
MNISSISAFSVRNWQFTLVVFGMLIAVGLSAFNSIPRAEDPDMKGPFAIVNVALPGADPADIEKLVIRPIEDAINRLDDLDEIKSRAEDGLAIIQVQFDWSTDPDKKYDDVVREINALRPTLPAGIRRLDINKFRTSLTNVVQVALVSETAPNRVLEDLADDLTDEIYRVPGVRDAEAWGLPRSEVRVSINFGRLANLGIPVTAVANAVGADASELPGGPIHAGARRFNLKTAGGYDSIEDIRNTVIGYFGGNIVRVRDVAEVSWATEEATYLGWYNGERAVFVTANQKEAQNVFDVRNGIYEVLDEFEPHLPADVRMERAFDQTVSVSHRLSRLYLDFAIAVSLVAITLLPLGFRAAGIVMVSIPLSLAMGVALLDFFGFSLNQLSIAGLVLALGLLVDDSIVVVENIERHLREGKKRYEAAIAATSQISLAVVGCTVVLILAFLPLLFLPGGAGKFTRSLPVSVLFTVSASLLVALTIIPFLASRLLSDKAHPEGNIFLRIVMRGIHTIYRPLLHIALGWPRATTFAAMLVCVTSLALVPRIGFSLFPPADSRQFLVQIETPQGTSLQETKKVLDYVTETLRARPEIDWVISNLGRSNPQIYYNENAREQRANKAEAFAQMAEFDQERTPILQDELRAEFNKYPGAQIVLRVFQNGPPIEAPIAVRIFGPDLRVLKELAADVSRIVEDVEGTRDVVNPVRLDRTDYNLGLNTEKAGLLGVPPGEIDRTVRLAIVGETVGAFREADGDEFPIVARLPLEEHHAIQALQNVFVPTASGASIPLNQLSSPYLESSPGRIDRFDRQRLVTVTAYTRTGYNTEKVTNEVFEAIASLPKPPGYDFRAGGEIEARQEGFSGLTNAVLIAIFGILGVLILEFRSFRTTLVVAGVIPLGIVGGLVGLWLSGYSLSFTAVIGFIALIGIEIKSSILLVDFTNQLRRQGVPLKEAVEQAGEIRFLPVLLTSMTAIGGLTALALEGSGLYSPLAFVIIGGLISSTVLSRLVTPAMYLLLAPKELDEPERAHAQMQGAPAD